MGNALLLRAGGIKVISVAMAALVLRGVTTWAFALLFLIFLTLRIDNKITWNWLIVFVPMWIYDVVSIIFSSFKLFAERNSSRCNQRLLDKLRKIWNLVVALLKIIFQVLLCVYLQYDLGIRLYAAFIPLWILLVGIIVDLVIFSMRSSARISRSTTSTTSTSRTS